MPISKDSYVHLHTHSDFSTLDGLAKTEDLAKAAKVNGHVACAITDHGSVSGHVAFYKACKSAGVKPILGLEAYLAFEEAPGSYKIKKKTEKARETNKKYNHLTILAQNKTGWKNLTKLSSLAYLEGFYYKPRIDVDLLSKHAEGLIVLSGCLSGPISIPLSKGDYVEAKRIAKLYKEILGDRFYGEIQPNSLDAQRRVNEGWRKLSKDLDIKLVASADLHYINHEDSVAQDARICISSGKLLKDPDRLQMTDEFWFRSTEEMNAAFGGEEQVILESRKISERIENYSILAEGKYFLPKFQPPSGYSSAQYLKKLTYEGLEKRFGAEVPKYLEKTNFELGVIEKLGFVDYFLIVIDIIAWARNNGVPVGPGRGSVAGSIVAYALGITDIDPVRYGLYFERFLNPDRVSMPDIDIDVCESTRFKVIDYIRRKYGDNCVCQILTFGTMKARMSVRDVCRIMGIKQSDANKLTNLIPDELNITLEEACKDNEPLRKERAIRKDFNDAIELAKKVEGINRHTGIHAAGIVISDLPLIERIPLYKPANQDIIATAFTMAEVEDVGLLKMDLLGLKTLTVIKDCIDLIHRTTNVIIDISSIPLDDPKTYAMLQRGDSRGVFQMEKDGFRKVLAELKPDRIEDLMAMVALYRPGPLKSGMVTSYLHRKHGIEPVTYDHPILEPIMSETYGTLVYQETIMVLANKLAGLSLVDADGIRKAIGKKKLDIMVKYKEKFIAGCIKTGLEPEKAIRLWDQIEKFAEYSFNKAHSAAYGTISYRTAYLKANYPVQYMCAYLTSVRGDSEKLAEFITECKSMGIKIVPPDINQSLDVFDVRKDKNDNLYILYGLEGIKSCGEAAVKNILEVRKQVGRFYSLRHFCVVVDSRVVNQKIVDFLAKSDAFCSTGVNRAQLNAIINPSGKKELSIIEIAANEKKNAGNISMFSETIEDRAREDLEKLPMLPDFGTDKILEIEAEVFGFYLTRNPLDASRQLLENIATHRCGELAGMDGQSVIVGGRVSGLREILDKNGQLMAFFQLEDFSGSISCVAFSRSWTQEVKNLVKTGAQLYIYGKVDENKEQPSLFVGTVTPVKTCNFKSAIEIDLTVETATPGLISSLRELTSSGENLVIYRVRNETTGVVRGPYTIGSVPEIASVKDKILNLLPLTATIKYGTHCNAVLAA